MLGQPLAAIANSNNDISSLLERADEGFEHCRIVLSVCVHCDYKRTIQGRGAGEACIQCLIVATARRMTDHGSTRSASAIGRLVTRPIVHDNRNALAGDARHHTCYGGPLIQGRDNDA